MSDRMRQVWEYTEAEWQARYVGTPARVAAVLAELPDIARDDRQDVETAVGYVLGRGWQCGSLAAAIKADGVKGAGDIAALVLSRLREIAQRPGPEVLVHRQVVREHERWLLIEGESAGPRMKSTDRRKLVAGLKKLFAERAETSPDATKVVFPTDPCPTCFGYGWADGENCRSCGGNGWRDGDHITPTVAATLAELKTRRTQNVMTHQEEV